MTAHVCAHCRLSIIGPAFVTDDGAILHAGHAAVYQRTKRGLLHECPACSTRGRVRDMSRPERRSRMVPDEMAWGSGNGMREETYTEYPNEKTCDLCAGEGYLDKPAVPVTETKITGFRRVP